MICLLDYVIKQIDWGLTDNENAEVELRKLKAQSMDGESYMIYENQSRKEIMSALTRMFTIIETGYIAL